MPRARSPCVTKTARRWPSMLVLSTQHDPDIKQKDLIEAVREHILKPVLPEKWLHKGTKYHINPTGKFVIGGPVGDAGLTGRKIIVDTYGDRKRGVEGRGV